MSPQTLMDVNFGFTPLYPCFAFSSKHKNKNWQISLKKKNCVKFGGHNPSLLQTELHDAECKRVPNDPVNRQVCGPFPIFPPFARVFFINCFIISDKRVLNNLFWFASFSEYLPQQSNFLYKDNLCSPSYDKKHQMNVTPIKAASCLSPFHCFGFSLFAADHLFTPRLWGFSSGWKSEKALAYKQMSVCHLLDLTHFHPKFHS